MKVSLFAAFLTVASILNYEASACSCAFVSPEEKFTSERTSSVHKVTVIKAYGAPIRVGSSGITYYDVSNDQTFKGCGKRPDTFTIQSRNTGTS